MNHLESLAARLEIDAALHEFAATLDDPATTIDHIDAMTAEVETHLERKGT